MCHKTIDTSNETPQGSPDSTHGSVVACYRNFVDTRPFQLLKLNADKPNRKSNRKPDKKPNRS